MSAGFFIDPVPGAYPRCRCTNDCEMPCWQLDGLTTDSCGACGCGPFELPAVYPLPLRAMPQVAYLVPRARR